MALAKGTSWPSVSAAIAIENNRRKKRRKKQPVDIETHRASQSRSTAGERARRQEISRPKTSTKRRTPPAKKPSARDVLRAAEQARNTGNYKKAEAVAKRAGFSQEGRTVFQRTASDLAKAIVYTPAGVYELGKAGAKDVGAATQGDLSFKRSRKLGKAIAKQTAADLRHPLRHPGNTLLDALAVASAGAGAVSRVSAAGKAAAAAKGARRVTQAVARPPHKGGSLLRAPAPGRVEIAPGVHQHLSRSPLVRVAQRARLKTQKKRPESRAGGGTLGRNLPERVGFERRRRERIVADVERAPAEALRGRTYKRKLSKGGRRELGRVEQTAIRVIAEGQPVAARIAAHKRDYAAATSSLARRRLNRKIALLKEVDRRGLVENVNGRPRPSRKLAPVYELAKASGARREAGLKEMGLLSAEQAASRRAAPGRVIEGAEYKTTRAQKARPAQVREYEVGERQIERPRTEAEARSRLAKLDAEYERAVAAIEDHLTGGQPADKAEVASRNLYNLKTKGRRRGRAKKPTVRQEVRGMAEAELHKMLEGKSAAPEVAYLRRVIEEREQLGRVLSDPERVFGAREARTGEFGSLRYSEPEKTIRRRFPARVASKGQRGLRGAEHVEPGELYVPYGKRRFLPTSRAQVGSKQGLGIPRGNVLHGAFTGASFKSGRFPDKAVRAIADAELEVQRYRSVLRIRNQAVAASISAEDYLALPEKLRDRYVPVRVRAKPYSAGTNEFLDLFQRKLDEGERLTPGERKQLGRRADEARARLFPDLAEAEALAAAAKGEVRFVDKRTLGGLNEPQGVYGALGAAATGADELNAAMQIAILFLKPAYAVPNTVGQAFLALSHQGALAPWNMGQAVRLFGKLSPEERAQVRAAAGLGLAKALPVERARLARGARNKLASGWEKVLDSPYRWPAFVHEARMLGYNTPAKIKALLGDESKLDDLVEVSQRTRDAMLDYAQMSPLEQKLVRRVVFFFPFLKASATYTGRFVRDHPIQAATLAQLSREGEAKAKRDLGAVPWYARGTFQVGEDEQGRPLVVNPRAAQLFESPVQFGQAAKQLTSRNPKQAGQSFEGLLSPAARFPLQLLHPHDPLGGYSLSTPEALKREFFESLPQARLVEELRHPTGSDKEKLYPTSRKGALLKFGAGTIYPRPVNKKELNARAAEEGLANVSGSERARRRVFAERQELFEAAKQFMPEELENGRLPAELRTAFNRKSERERSLIAIEASTEPKSQERERGKFEAEVELLRRWSLVTAAEAAEAIRWANAARYDDLTKQRRRISGKYFADAYGDLLLYAKNALNEKGADLR